MKRYRYYFLMCSLCCMLGGCSQTIERSTLEEAELPWGRPADWETSMPIAPGVQY